MNKRLVCAVVTCNMMVAAYIIQHILLTAGMPVDLRPWGTQWECLAGSGHHSQASLQAMGAPAQLRQRKVLCCSRHLEGQYLCSGWRRWHSVVQHCAKVSSASTCCIVLLTLGITFYAHAIAPIAHCLTCCLLPMACGLLRKVDHVLCCRCDTSQHNSSWMPVAPMKIERGSLAVATMGDYIYAIGGGKPNVQYDSVER